MEFKKNKGLNFEKFDILNNSEKLEYLMEYWDIESLIFVAEYREIEDYGKEYGFNEFINLRYKNGKKIENPFKGGIQSRIRINERHNLKRKKIKDGDIVIFSCVINENEYPQGRSKRPIAIDSQSIEVLEKIQTEDLLKNKKLLSLLDENIVREIEYKFNKSNSIIYSEKFTGDGLSLLGHIEEQCDEVSEKINVFKKEKASLEIIVDDLKKEIFKLNTTLEEKQTNVDLTIMKVKRLKEEEEKLENSLSEIIEREKKYVNLGLIENKVVNSINKGRRLKDNKSRVDHIINYLRRREDKPLIYEREIIEQFIVGINTNQIVVIGGAPGAGKTSLIEGVAEAINAKCKLVSVRPNWNNTEDLLGFYNPIEKMYVGTSFIDTIMEASENRDVLYFICLDEMNIACVEEYFSEFLSVMCTEEKELNLYSKEIFKSESSAIDMIIENTKSKDRNELVEVLGISEFSNIELRKKNLERYKPVLKIPSNIRFVGTINRDATTKDLSPKVVDRSVIINLNSSFETFKNLVSRKKEPALQTRYVAPKDLISGKEEYKKTFDKFEKILEFLNNNSIELNFRFLEVAGRMLNVEGIDEEDLIDYIIATKVLPKINVDETSFDKEKFEILIKEYSLSLKIYKEMLQFYEVNNILSYWR